MNTPDFGTTLESIKHIGDMVDGKMVCRKDCPSITHRNTPDTEWEEIKDEIYTLLHEFHGECVKEPFDGEPLQRRARKNRYTDTIFNIFTVLLTSRDTYWKGTNQVFVNNIIEDIENMKGVYSAQDAITKALEIIKRHTIR